MIKEIHCFGTSHTAGGGFEFFNKERASKLKKVYTEKPLNQFNYSYPGQLQKLIGDGVKVYNHAKSGYGNERMYRIAYDLITEDIQSLSEKLFIFEFSFLGRKEFYSNTLKDHFIVNYEILENGANVNGIAQSYFENHVETYELLKNKVSPFIRETMQGENQIKTLRMNNAFFIDFLLQRNVNFLLATPPYGFNHENDPDGLKYQLKDRYIRYSDTERTLYGYYFNNGWTITNETNGFIKDNHAGLHGNKETAKRILENIDKLYDYEYIEYTYDDEFENKKLI
jgi:hypothetical protein